MKRRSRAHDHSKGGRESIRGRGLATNNLHCQSTSQQAAAQSTCILVRALSVYEAVNCSPVAEGVSAE